MRYAMGIDGGGTKTAIAIADETGRILGLVRTGPSYHVGVYLTMDEVVRTVRQGVADAVTQAGMTSPQEIEVICSSLNEKYILPLKGTIQWQRIICSGENELCQAAAVEAKDDYGISAVVGTGVAISGRNRTGQTAGGGHWGPIMGDEGSGYYIGRLALVAAARAFDGRAQDTVLISKLLDHYGLSDFSAIASKVYTHGDQTKRSEIARLAPLVTLASGEGDRVATEILRTAGTEIGIAINAVARRLGMLEEEFEITLSGGVLEAGDVLLNALKDEILGTIQRARIIRPRFEQVIGAVLIALKDMGVRLDDRLYREVESTSLMHAR